MKTKKIRKIHTLNFMYVNPWASLVAQMVKNLSADAGDVSSIPGWERSPGKENGNPPQYSCLENPIERGAWRATVHCKRIGHNLGAKTTTTTTY